LRSAPAQCVRDPVSDRVADNDARRKDKTGAGFRGDELRDKGAAGQWTADDVHPADGDLLCQRRAQLAQASGVDQQ
jgi:hypothetical protein